MRVKQVLGMFLAVTLTMGTLTGCGGTNAGTNDTNADSSKEEEITLRVLATGSNRRGCERKISQCYIGMGDHQLE